ncbi:ATP-binding protein [Arcobacter lanthieri]|uniref:AAA family ATPase n=1 Tax=Aliarcobacter lanthieri TaxID=1355374 RepID=UPI001920955B|nr:ATP-binding protein [Aliarcobacter lanthieri]MBL3518948.1 ATP-binding protein [Aliarcobacter lanthieri]
MLLEFGGRNFYSFKEGFQVNLRKGKEISKVLALKGSNASGKTSALKLLPFLSYFVAESFSLKDDSKIPLFSFFNNDNPVTLYVKFISNKIEYEYEVELTKDKVIHEKFYRKDIIILERNYNLIITNKIEELDWIKDLRLKSNASIVSTLEQYGIEKIESSELIVFLNFFTRIMSNITLYGLMEDFSNYNLVSKVYNENKKLLKFTINFLQKVGTGIKDITINSIYNEEKKENIYFPVFHYDVEGKEKTLAYSEQSSGTKSLYRQLAIYKSILDVGGILILDELDMNLHPDLIPPLVHFFNSKKINKNNSQLLFTTHNTEIMDKLTKYNIVLVNKEENESYLYRLDETGEIIRNDRPISKIYNSGRLGGKPIIEIEYE